MMLETRGHMLEIEVTNDEGHNAHLGFNRRRVKRFTALSPSLIAITTYSSFNRRRVGCFIEQTFHRSYGAEIVRHYPTLMSVHDKEGNRFSAFLGNLGCIQWNRARPTKPGAGSRSLGGLIISRTLV